ncbi:MAG: ATP-binding protein, partial [Campylobacteraceae bacterium]|nr:ATP-binding protein [Campylobacteraceae bacterium]
VLGFSTVFILMGASASYIGQFFMEYKEYIAKIGGALVVFFGIHFTGLFLKPNFEKLSIGIGLLFVSLYTFGIFSLDTFFVFAGIWAGVMALYYFKLHEFLYRQFKVEKSGKATGLSSFIVGLTFGAGWSPCIGPILGSILMIAMNIVKRKRIERILDDTWRLVKEGDIVLFRWLNDENLTVTFVSNSISKFGYVPDDLLQKTTMYADIIYKDDLKIVLESLRQHIENELESFSCTYRIKNRDSGKLRWVFSHAIFIKDDFGNVTDLYGYIYDITAIKQGEHELELRVKEEVSKNIAKDKILVQQNKLAAMGEMIGAIAHQWRQPLNNISLILHFIRDNFDNKKIDKEMISNYVDKGNRQIEYMSHTIDDFRNFYKPSKKRANFSIKEALNSTVEIMNAKLEQKDIRVQILVEDFTLNSFENEFKQAVLNIISNAKDAIFQKKEEEKDFKGIIYIVGKKIKENYEIIISNNGSHITQKIMDRMFEPYFTTKFEKQGTGIGLYMTKMIIENSMLGSIEVNNINDGVEFKIILPI